MKTLATNLLHLLEMGFNPYEDNTELENKYFSNTDVAKSNNGNNSSNIILDGKTTVIAPNVTQNNKINKKNKSNKNTVALVASVASHENDDEKVVTFKQALQIVMPIKEKVLSENSFKKFRSRINQFSNWLKERDLLEADVKQINRKIAIQYLNYVLEKTSARNRNNTRTDLSAIFQLLVDNFIIDFNFMREIKVLRAKPTRNKTYSKEQLQLLNWKLDDDPILKLLVKFISYNFLRPIEVLRLKVGDINIEEKNLYVRAKNQPVKTKIIPEILLKDLPNLTKLDKDWFLFTPNKIGGEWNIEESNKRTYFTKRFKKIKDQLGLGKDYGLYSFRHTYITKLYREIAKDSTPFATKSKLMLITGHTSMTALEKYLRDIDAQLPSDYSEYLES